MAMLTATNENFEAIISQDTVVVEFWAPWCGYCKRLAPVIKQIAEKETGVDFVTVNIDELPAIAEHFDVETIPSLFVFHKGNPSQPLIAPQAKALIMDWLREQQAIPAKG